MSSSTARILVVDDEELIRLNLVAFLEDEGYDMISAESGEDALLLITSAQPVLGIMDMRLPGMNGNELILKAHELHPAMTFLIHTGSSAYILPEELKQIGIQPDQVFMKPISDMTLLLTAIQQLIKR